MSQHRKLHKMAKGEEKGENNAMLMICLRHKIRWPMKSREMIGRVTMHERWNTQASTKQMAKRWNEHNQKILSKMQKNKHQK